MMSGSSGLKSSIDRLMDQIAGAAAKSGRPPGAVTLVAVTKTVDRAAVDRAYEAGVRHFGENRVQAALAKFALPLPADATLHLIGQLQTNKAAVAARLFDRIDAVDRASLITELQKQGAKLDRQIAILLQVNIAREAQKAGCDLAEVESLLDQIRVSPNLKLQGLMTIAPLVEDAEEARPVFRGLRELRDRVLDAHPEVTLPVLSMGMSNDFVVAIEEGATDIRVGRALFTG